MERAKWEIIHIPEKPPVSPTHQPTVDVLASVIDPKLANTLVRRLNQIAPLENFRHVKRIQKKHMQGGLQICCIIERRVGRAMQAMANIISSTNLQY